MFFRKKTIQWVTPSESLILHPNEVHLWRMFYADKRTQFSDYQNRLSTDELERAGQFRFPKDAQQFILRRGWLRETLSLYLKENPRFTYHEYGKPSLQNSSLKFNLSDAEGCVLLGLTSERDLGVDLENLRDMDFQATAKTAFSSIEYQKWMKSGASQDRFFEIWTEKEAYLKALGTGFQTPDVQRPTNWRLYRIRFQNYLGALVIQGRVKIRYFE